MHSDRTDRVVLADLAASPDGRQRLDRAVVRVADIEVDIGGAGRHCADLYACRRDVEVLRVRSVDRQQGGIIHHGSIEQAGLHAAGIVDDDDRCAEADEPALEGDGRHIDLFVKLSLDLDLVAGAEVTAGLCLDLSGDVEHGHGCAGADEARGSVADQKIDLHVLARDDQNVMAGLDIRTGFDRGGSTVLLIRRDQRGIEVRAREERRVVQPVRCTLHVVPDTGVRGAGVSVAAETGHLAGQFADAAIGLFPRIGGRVVAAARGGIAGRAFLLVGVIVLEILSDRPDRDRRTEAHDAADAAEGKALEDLNRVCTDSDIVAGQDVSIRADRGCGVVLDAAEIDATTDADEADGSRAGKGRDADIIGGVDINALPEADIARMQLIVCKALVDRGTRADGGQSVGIDDCHTDRTGNADIEPAGAGNGDMRNDFRRLRLDDHAVRLTGKRGETGRIAAAGRDLAIEHVRDTRAVGARVDRRVFADRCLGILGDVDDANGASGTAAGQTDGDRTGNDGELRFVLGHDGDIAAGLNRRIPDARERIGIERDNRDAAGEADGAAYRKPGGDDENLFLRSSDDRYIIVRVYERVVANSRLRFRRNDRHVDCRSGRT
ncbi:hypothetical protein D9M68_186160 [compost metagenome]